MARVSILPLALGAAGVTALAIVGVVVAVKGCGGDERKPGPAGPSSGAIVGAEGMNARGTAELRAAGCTNAVVVDMQRLLGAGGKVREGEPRYMVTCDVPSVDAAPTCEKLAGTYFLAVGGAADANVCVRVLPSGAKGPSCSRLFAPSGADLGPFPRP